MSHDRESASNFWASLQNVFFQVVQLIDLRLALAIGLLAFMVAVGFDSAGNQAEAADLINRSHLNPAPSVTIVNQSNLRAGAASARGLEASQNDATLATAKRLRHGTMTSAVMTSSRLTQAHFFTDLPSGG